QRRDCARLLIRQDGVELDVAEGRSRKRGDTEISPEFRLPSALVDGDAHTCRVLANPPDHRLQEERPTQGACYRAGQSVVAAADSMETARPGRGTRGKLI